MALLMAKQKHLALRGEVGQARPLGPTGPPHPPVGSDGLGRPTYPPAWAGLMALLMTRQKHLALRGKLGQARPLGPTRPPHPPVRCIRQLE